MKRFEKSAGRIRAIVPALALLLAASCSETAPPAAQQAAAEQTPAAAAVGSASGAAGKAASTERRPSQNSGVVKTAQTAGAYTYLQVDVGGEDFWLATMATAVQPGQKVTWQDYAAMNNFKSKALGREFEQILFVDRVLSEQAAKEQAAKETVQRGIVQESLSAAGYSFIRVDQNGSSIWLAAPETSIDVGQSISWSGGAPMRNFTSRSLDRTFEEILFVGAVNRT